MTDVSYYGSDVRILSDAVVGYYYYVKDACEPHLLSILSRLVGTQAGMQPFTFKYHESEAVIDALEWYSAMARQKASPTFYFDACEHLSERADTIVAQIKLMLELNDDD